MKHYDELKELDVQVLGVSVDPRDKARFVTEKLKAPFPILSDTARGVMKLYGTSSPVYNAPDGGPLNTPTLILIDRAGIIRWIHQSTDYRIRATISEDLAEARKLK